MEQPRAVLDLDQRGDRNAVAATGRRLGRHERVGAAGAVEQHDRQHAARLDRGEESVAGLESELREVETVALGRAQPAVLRQDHRHRLVGDGGHRQRGRGDRLLLDQGAPIVAETRGIGLDLLDDRLAHRLVRTEQLFELGLFPGEFGDFLFELDPFEARELAQADLEDVLRLHFGEAEGVHQRRLRLVALADDADHLVDVQERDLAPFEDVQATIDLVEAVPAAAGDGREAEVGPLGDQHLHRLAAGIAVEADDGEVHLDRGFEAGRREEEGHQLVAVDLRGLRLDDEAHRGRFVRLVARVVDQGEDALPGGDLLRLQLVLLRVLQLRVGERVEFLEHLLRRTAGRELGDHHLPLVAREFLDLVARTHAQRTLPALVGGTDVGRRRDQLAAAREIRSGKVLHQLVGRELGIADLRDAGGGDFAQIVRRQVAGHADGDARGAVQERERQPGRQHLRLLERAVVIVLEIDGAHANFGEQQFGDRREPDFRVAHRRRGVSVERAEVALPVHQRVTHGEVLRQAHHRVVNRGVAVRVQLAEHVADDARRLHGLRVGLLPGLPHAVEDALLHRLLAVVHHRNRAVLDRHDRVGEVGAFGEAADGNALARLFFGKGAHGHSSIW